MTNDQSNIFPALRSRIGDWWFYVTTLTFPEVAQWIKLVDDVHERQELKTWIQRKLRPERETQIEKYLIQQKQHFFNAIVVGIYGGEPEWFPVEVGESITLGDVELSERQSNAFGFLRLSGQEDIFALDGQHRVEGIKRALKNQDGKKLDVDELVVIFVSHKRTADGVMRTRRLFTTLNKFAKPVSKAELIALNDDDSFAIVTRRLIEEYGGLGIEFVPLAPTANIPNGDQSCITTAIALYELVRAIGVKAGSSHTKSLEIGPPEESRVEDMYKLVTSYWDALKKCIPEIAKVMKSRPHENIANQFRTKTGGHLLFRPAGMAAFARATRILVDRKMDMDSAVSKLSMVPLSLSKAPWRDVLWNPATNTMIVKHKKLSTNILLHKIGVDPQPSSYKVLEEYRKILGDSTAKI